ncbi:Sulfotransferase domain protein [Posidoniimonas polymericola]|uniref:Sulfotransferase domain protein n=2 Tax=Posidoniimonas polymericola TaxID=2528002 RepID=A0A5C5YUA4_9BACT|nr:Sulfotransferase domain protein [Posidoniimonas polymericola]
MKCGTTSLHDYLSRHPSFSMSQPKELDFFVGRCSSNSMEWYCSHFDASKQFRGESSQNYTKAHSPLYAGAAERVASVLPNCKLIYLVRDPIARYQSHKLETLYGETRRDIAWAKENNHYVKTGLYYYQLSHYLNYFSLEQVMVVDLADLKDRRLDTMNAIFRFLGASELDNPGVFDFQSNSFAEKVAPRFIRENIAYRVANRIAPKLTASVFSSDRVRRTLMPNSRPTPLTEGEKDRLSSIFEPDVNKLRKLLGRDFSDWAV